MKIFLALGIILLAGNIFLVGGYLSVKLMNNGKFALLKMVLTIFITFVLGVQTVKTGIEAMNKLDTLLSSAQIQKNEIIVCESPATCNIYFEQR